MEDELNNEETGHETIHSDIDLSKEQIDEEFWEQLESRHA